MTIGNFPPQILEAYEWYQIGANEATGKNDCPITSNGAFCAGWRSNNTSWYDTEGCSDSYPGSGPFSSNLVGCPLDALNQTGMAKPHILVGTWNYLNESSNKIHLVVRGTIVFSSLGNFTLTIPNHSGFGPFTQEWSWGLQNDTKHPNILTICGDGITGCDNETLVSTSLNHAVIKDLHGDLISLTRNSGYPFSLIGVRLMDNLLSRTNKNGTVIPGATFNPYIDLSNPDSSRPFVTAINDSSFEWKPREINETKTMWNMFNSTSGSNGTIIFTDCTVPNINGSWIQCPKEPPIFYRELNNNLHKGIWSLVYPIEKTGMTPVLELCTWYVDCNNLIVQKISKDHVQLMDSHGGKLYLTDPVTPKGSNRTISLDQANKLLNENRNITAYAKCIAAGHDWEDGFCQSGRLVGITGPTVCHHTSEGQTCESGSVAGSGWIPVKYINHTATDPGCTRLTDHPNYESCVDVTNTNATEPIKWTNFTNATWTIYNSTSGSSSTITFKTIPHDYKDGDFTFGMNVTTFVRTLNGHTYKGILGDDNGLIGSTDTTFMLCSNQWRIESSGLMHLGCHTWNILIITPDHMDFKDQHDGTIHLTRDGSHE